jgi:hypothetical protein
MCMQKLKVYGVESVWSWSQTKKIPSVMNCVQNHKAVRVLLSGQSCINILMLKVSGVGGRRIQQRIHVVIQTNV